MAVDIEVNLRIPSLTLRDAAQPGQRIDNSGVRFRKRATVPAVPKAGDHLPVTVGGLDPCDCTVSRSDWDEHKHIFVVACTWGRRSISTAEYEALVADTEWISTPLI